MPALVLTCFRIYSGLQVEKLVKKKPKIVELDPKYLKSNLANLYCLETSPMAIIDKNDVNSMCFGLFRE